MKIVHHSSVVWNNDLVTFFGKMVNKRDSENHWSVIKTMPERKYRLESALYAQRVLFQLSCYSI